MSPQLTRMIRRVGAPLGLASCLLGSALAQTSTPTDSQPTAAAAAAAAAPQATSTPRYDAALARSLGADERGMRPYVLVILKTGPKKMPAGPARDAMFRGHFANMSRLAAEGKLAVAGPLDGVDGWRGVFVFAVAELDEARALAASDPVLIEGEMVAEFHKFYASAGLMAVREIHDKIQGKAP